MRILVLAMLFALPLTACGGMIEPSFGDADQDAAAHDAGARDVEAWPEAEPRPDLPPSRPHVPRPPQAR